MLPMVAPESFFLNNPHSNDHSLNFEEYKEFRLENDNLLAK